MLGHKGRSPRPSPGFGGFDELELEDRRLVLFTQDSPH
jgi:hypothetical protein